MITVKIIKSKKIKKLSIFDFDDTLFKSPDKPKGYKGNWWIQEKSLSSELIGEIPDDSYWNLDVVSSALKEISDKNTICVMMTGRIGNVFEERIKQLLKQKQLNFKKFYFNSFGQDTAQYKIDEINKILKKYNSIKNIEMWDDDSEKIELYNKEFNNYNLQINKV